MIISSNSLGFVSFYFAIAPMWSNMGAKSGLIFLGGGRPYFSVPLILVDAVM